jgi:heptosyltransferase-1
MAQTLGYSIDALPLDYGIARTVFPPAPVSLPQPFVVALHGTSRVDKEWSEGQWQALLAALAQRGCHTLLPWGNQREHERAIRLAEGNAFVQVLPRCGLGELAGILQAAQAVIGMDTGLMHIAAALDKPGVALYPVTMPELTGVLGNSQSDRTILTLGGEATADTARVIQQLLDCLC